MVRKAVTGGFLQRRLMTLNIGNSSIESTMAKTKIRHITCVLDAQETSILHHVVQLAG